MRRRVLFFLPSLGGGGAESHTARVINHLDRDRFEPSVAVTRLGGSYERFLRDDVRLSVIGPAGLASSTGRLIAAAPGLCLEVKRLAPDVVVSVLDLPSLVALAALRPWPSRPRLVPCVQIPPSVEYGRSRLGRRLVLPAIRLLYPTADRVIALSHGVAHDLTGVAPRLVGRISVIHNACVDDRLLSEPDVPPAIPETRRPVVLAAGRLVPQKGFGDLLEAFAKVRRASDAELWILGEGPERPALEKQISTLGLVDSVRLLGFQPHAQSFMKRATVFALSSHYEGFGNVIAEALACGAPVVSTDCPHGPSEILEQEVSGLLVPVAQPVALAAAISRVLSDPVLRARLVEGGKRRSTAFRAETVAREYADELERICKSE